MSRNDDPRMEYYKYVYESSKLWDGKESLEGKTIIVYGEQGYGDVIQFARCIRPLKERRCKVIFHTPEKLHRLFKCLDVDLFDKASLDVPQHDYHVLSMDLPFLLNPPQIDFPYLTVEGKSPLDPKPDNQKWIGIAWEGNPNNPYNAVRNCPLKHFRVLEKPDVKFFMMQTEIHDQSLLDGCEDMELFSFDRTDFFDTALAIQDMDLIVTVDTALLHLAGALDKRTIGVVSIEGDPRWYVSTWYKSVWPIRQSEPKNWEDVFLIVSRLANQILYS